MSKVVYPANRNIRRRILREYQKQADRASIDLLNNVLKQYGIIIMPTGAGKTVMFTSLIEYAMLNADAPLKILVIHPRLLLSQEQMGRIEEDLNHIRKIFRLTTFSSAKHVSSVANENNHLDAKNWEELELRNAEENEQHLITFSSYDSAWKLVSEHAFDLIICDEAHNLCLGNGYSATIDNVETRLDQLIANAGAKVLYYTATPIYAFDADKPEQTMSDKNIYGEPIISIAPKDLHKLGYIVPPYFRILNAESVQRTDSNGQIVYKAEQIISTAFIDQHADMTGGIYGKVDEHKMLVALEDAAFQFNETNDNVEYIKAAVKEKTGCDVTLVTIRAGGVYVNGKLDSRPRQEVIRWVDQHNGNVIVCHFDTLAEGINIESFSGLLALRGLNQIKLIQHLGRPGRALKQDMDEHGEPLPINQRKKWQFPVTFVCYNDNLLSGNRALDIVQWLLESGYDELAVYLDLTKDDAGRGPTPDEPSDPVRRIRDDVVTDYNARQFAKELNWI